MRVNGSTKRVLQPEQGMSMELARIVFCKLQIILNAWVLYDAGVQSCASGIYRYCERPNWDCRPLILPLCTDSLEKHKGNLIKLSEGVLVLYVCMSSRCDDSSPCAPLAGHRSILRGLRAQSIHSKQNRCLTRRCQEFLLARIGC